MREADDMISDADLVKYEAHVFGAGGSSAAIRRLIAAVRAERACIAALEAEKADLVAQMARTLFEMVGLMYPP